LKDIKHMDVSEVALIQEIKAAAAQLAKNHGKPAV
jgi:hypothetical protein